MRSNNNKIITQMYFEEKIKPVDISKKINISKSAVTKVLKKDSRYKNEKQKRIEFNQMKHTEDTKLYIKQKRKELQHKNSVDDLVLKKLHDQASRELSGPRKLTNRAYREWNKSAYTYNQKKRQFEFRKELESQRSFDVPKIIKVEVF